MTQARASVGARPHDAGWGRRAAAALRAAVRAPWQDVAPLVVVLCGVMWTALTVADLGGWHAVRFYPGHEPRLVVAASFATVTLALAGRRWATLAATIVAAGALAAWVREGMVGHFGRHLDYVTVPLTPERPGATSFPALEITAYGVVGLLVLAALLASLTWVIAGRRGGPSGTGHRRGSERAVMGIAGAVASAIVLPRLGMWLAHVIETLLGTGQDQSAYGSQTLWLIVLFIVATYGATFGLRSRFSAASLAAGIVAFALLVPAVWLLVGPLSEFGAPFDWIVSGAGTVLAMWVVALAAGVALLVRAAARAGCAADALSESSGPTSSRPAWRSASR